MRKRYFREHRGLYVDSMETIKEVQSVDDIIKFYDNDPLVHGYFKNIRIDPTTHREHRDPHDKWGKDTYMVVADFDGYTGQCIAFANFCDS